MLTLRSTSTEREYENFRKHTTDRCPFCEKDFLVREDFTFPGHFIAGWMILENRFPYDRVFKTSHMLAPVDHIGTLSNRQERELKTILYFLEDEYDAYFFNTTGRQTLPKHWHIHLLNFK